MDKYDQGSQYNQAYCYEALVFMLIFRIGSER